MKQFVVFVLVYSMTYACIAEEDGNSIGYSSVEEALIAVKSSPDAEITIQEGWIIASIGKGKDKTMWSFTPDTHPAHPAAIKRNIVEKDGHLHLGMKVLCQAKKQECDLLVEQFKQLNNNIMRSLNGGT